MHNNQSRQAAVSEKGLQLRAVSLSIEKGISWVAYPLVVIHQAAPIQQVQHGLEAEDGLPLQLRNIRQHCQTRSYFDWLVALCPCKLLKPNLHVH